MYISLPNYRRATSKIMNAITMPPTKIGLASIGGWRKEPALFLEVGIAVTDPEPTLAVLVEVPAAF